MPGGRALRPRFRLIKKLSGASAAARTGLGLVKILSVRSMYKIDRRGGVQKSFSRNIPPISLKWKQ